MEDCKECRLKTAQPTVTLLHQNFMSTLLYKNNSLCENTSETYQCEISC